jgi:hypothetical protein
MYSDEIFSDEMVEIINISVNNIILEKYFENNNSIILMDEIRIGKINSDIYENLFFDKKYLIALLYSNTKNFYFLHHINFNFEYTFRREWWNNFMMRNDISDDDSSNLLFLEIVFFLIDDEKTKALATFKIIKTLFSETVDIYLEKSNGLWTIISYSINFEENWIIYENGLTNTE